MYTLLRVLKVALQVSPFQLRVFFRHGFGRRYYRLSIVLGQFLVICAAGIVRLFMQEPGATSREGHREDL